MNNFSGPNFLEIFGTHFLGTDQSMLDKLNKFLKSNDYYEIPHKREAAFIIAHYAGKVKYQIMGFREKNKARFTAEFYNHHYYSRI